MKPTFTTALLTLFLAAAGMAIAGDDAPAPSNGVPYPAGWQDWSVVAMSHRTDNNTVRVILGNDIAVRAARSGETNPWPDGAILGKVVWKETALEQWPAAVAPGQFVHAEFMFKDAAAHAGTGGWAWARWLGPEQKPFDEGMQSCVACHTPVAGRDWVFTDPAPLPRQD